MNPSTSLFLTLALALAFPAAADDDVALQAGDVAEFELSGLPSRYEGAGAAVCTGTIISAVGPQEGRCERSFRFEVPPGAAKLVYTFVASGGGRETRIELPVTRSTRPIVFTAPAAGALRSPAPVTIPAEAAVRAAKAAATAQCGACRGGSFALQSFEVTKPAAPVDGGFGIRIKLTTKGTAAPGRTR